MAEAKKHTRKELDAALVALRKRYGHRKNITGFDVGYRWKDDAPTNDLAARIHVSQKIPLAELEDAEAFPSDVDGVPIDVIQGRYRVSRTTQPSDHQQRFPILMGGISCGRPGDATGTMGAIVIDKITGSPSLLSNWHVAIGAYGRDGDPICQPGPADGWPQPEDVVARTARSILDIDGDAAIAPLTGARAWLPISYGTFKSPVSVRDSRLGEILEKSGRSTGLTRAKVDGEGFYRISYEVAPERHEIREISGFKLAPEKPGNPDNVEVSHSGDSGGLWVSPKSDEAVGLHFAGETSDDPRLEHAIACNMTKVVDRLNIRLATFDDLLNGTGRGSEALTFAPGGQAPYPVPAMANTRGRGSSSELSLPPDWPYPPIPPEWPWPCPPFPPYPPFPPRDWRWPLDDRRLGARLGLHGIPERVSDTIGGLGARAERLGTATISLGDEIFPAFRAALESKAGHRYGDIDYNTKFYPDFIRPERSIAPILFNAVVYFSQKFENDGISEIARLRDFKGLRTFGNACDLIANLYREAGWNVRS